MNKPTLADHQAFMEVAVRRSFRQAADPGSETASPVRGSATYALDDRTTDAD
jgi:hypothetical protein